jgi:hypothetical protein
LKCIKEDEHLSNLSDITDMSKLFFDLDEKTGLNFYDYLFLRRVQNALDNCGDNSVLQPVKIKNQKIKSKIKNLTPYHI